MSHSVHPADERLPIARLVPPAIQHVLVMYAGAVAVPLIIGRAVNLPPEQVSFLISADLFACGQPPSCKAWVFRASGFAYR